MRNLLLSAVLLLSLGVVAPAQHAPPHADLNPAVLAAARAVPDGGEYNGAWTGSGTPHAVVINGFEVLAAGDGTYCSGFSFTVATDAGLAAGLFEGVSNKQLRTFQKMWYGAFELEKAKDAEERERVVDIRERQLQVALPWLGIGEAVDPEDARPGDFVQFWRTRSGHSAVFTGWLRDDAAGPPTGLRYRSSQKATGVADASERFRGSGGAVDPERVYFGRLKGR